MFLKIHSKSVVIHGYLSEWIANDQSPFGFDHKDQSSQSGIMEGECSMAYCQHFSENSLKSINFSSFLAKKQTDKC